MSTGDMLNNLRCLQSCLKAVKIQLPDNKEKALKTGAPDVFVQILRSTLLEYSHHIAQLIASHQIQLSVMNDARFIDGVYKVLRDIFNYKPSISKDMFLSTGFAERKVLMMQDIIRMVQKKNQELGRKKKTKGRKTTGASKPKPLMQPISSGACGVISPISSSEPDSCEESLPQTVAVTAAPRPKSGQQQVMGSKFPLPPPAAPRPKSDHHQVVYSRPALSPDEEPRSHAALVTRHLPHSSNPPMPCMSHDQGYKSTESSPTSEPTEKTTHFENRLQACMTLTDVLYSRLKDMLSRIDRLEGILSGVEKNILFKDEGQGNAEKLASVETQLKTVMDRLVLMENQVVILNTLGDISDLKSPPRNRGMNGTAALSVGSNTDACILEANGEQMPGSEIPNVNHQSTSADISMPLTPSSSQSSASPVTSDLSSPPTIETDKDLRNQIDRVNNVMKATKSMLKSKPSKTRNSTV